MYDPAVLPETLISPVVAFTKLSPEAEVKLPPLTVVVGVTFAPDEHNVLEG